MDALSRLGPDDLRAAVAAYRDVLSRHRDELNRLNVYPVPDGDTGTNMALTLESVAAELEGAGADMASVCRALSHGSLMGARGNSGVILSQVLRGLADRLAPVSTVDGPAVAEALCAASAAAYRAVVRPVEGTILTVARDSAEAADQQAQAGGSLLEVLEAAAARSRESLARTPQLLPVLAEAGVVDAGGAGLCLLFDALLHVVDGRPLPEPSSEAQPATTTATRPGEATHAVGDLRYEVMCFLDAADEAVEGLKKAWSAAGDSVVVVGGDGLWNCHVHTDDIGAAIEAAIDAGRPRDIRVTDLAEQVDACGDARPGTRPAEPPHSAAGAVPVTSVVAVAAGEGVAKILRSLGVEEVVAGGQSANPSTAEILAAVDSVSAGQVVVLPNNANVVPVARQVDALTAKTVRVVPTGSLAQGLAAMLGYDAAADVDGTAEAMAKAAAAVTAGEVTRAVRDATTPAGPVRAGDWLGLADGDVCVVAANAAEAACALLDRLVGDEHELVTVLVGEGAGEQETHGIVDWLDRHRPRVSTEVHDGGQPLYPYVFGVE
jgi:DAK2 domain fusion protein YloV